MNKIACQYAIVRFTPFIETGEFANVGIVIIAPKLRFFSFELAVKRYSRITRFFNEIDASVYKKTLNNFKEEMNRVAELIKQENTDSVLTTSLFDEITRPRETILRFSEVRTVLTNNPEGELQNIFSYYVERNFITKEYKEALLVKDVKKKLDKANAGTHFSKDKVGDEAYHVEFPFVQRNDSAVKIIKPLYLAQDDSTKIYNHGLAWVSKVRKLEDKNSLQTNNVLFTLAPPKKTTSNRFNAYEEIKNDLIQTGVQVINFNHDSNQLIEFAKR